jgi:hypothetical protein
VEYGMALFWVAVALVCLLGFLSGRGTPVYFGDSGPLVLGGDNAL